MPPAGYKACMQGKKGATKSAHRQMRPVSLHYSSCMLGGPGSASVLRILVLLINSLSTLDLVCFETCWNSGTVVGYEADEIEPGAAKII